MRISAALPTGVAALLFEAARGRRAREQALLPVLEAAGYDEVILPILDYLEPYEPLLGTASRGELYRFVDRDGELLSLRADFTPMLARLLAPRLAALRPPLRLFYRGDVVRYHQPRAGGERELYQLGAELLGLPGEAAEEELLRLFLRLLAASGGASLQIVLGFAGALDELLLGAATGAAGSRPPADLTELVAAVGRRERSAARRASPALLAVVEHGLPEHPAELGPLAGARLGRLLALRDALAAEFPAAHLAIDLAEFAAHTLAPALGALAPREASRGYYDGLLFRAYAAGAAPPVGSGGRYDRLFARLGAPIAAVGFTLDVDRLP